MTVFDACCMPSRPSQITLGAITAMDHATVVEDLGGLVKNLYDLTNYFRYFQDDGELFGVGALSIPSREVEVGVAATLAKLTAAKLCFISVLVEACAYADTRNMSGIQAMLHYCNDHVGASADGGKEEKEEKMDDTFQAFAVLAISLIAMGEEIGAEMALRQFNHLMHYGEPVIRKAVPLAIALVSASNPQLPLLDTLSKYSHNNDLSVALNAIFAMGIIGAGTNNARLGQMLRQLAGYYQEEPGCLFMVHVAQGLVQMGRGTIGINPFFDREIMSKPAVADLLGVFTAFLDTKAFILDKYHWMFFFLVPPMYPRCLITLDEDLRSIPVTVRVGQAVDVVGQAGESRTISSFQTHQTPVRLGTTERGELGTEEYISFAHVMEGFVILQKNPGWEKEDKMDV
ncbi:hypothetical protein P691DRAFT_785976 [Macrolepiota fuliginosa MF-IS2]|uniref:26S proteasome non-ATPase regulatory subunit RPN1 C-terminal domain-containing protein n=1 Tax=Macrolepiota fuliginosa MF-IS2 TaxID=1400762 RepID=A0A9P6C0R5_9AGAR|nr:hypothetical protein P691DRAFT_785976 [Macrolepiota fuliginosa MF-IS2]